MAPGSKEALSADRPSRRKDDSRTGAARESPRAASIWVDRGHRAEGTLSRARSAARCLWTDSNTPMYRRHHRAAV